MHRDFSESEKAKLLGYVKDDQDKNDNRFFGKFIDFFADIAHYSNLDINDYLLDIDDYHKKLIDAQNMTVDSIEKLFEAVHAVDEATTTRVDMLNMLIESLSFSIEGLKNIVTIGKYASSNRPLMLTIEEYNRLVDEISIPDIVAFASIYDAYREGDYELVQNYIDQQVNDLGRDVTAFGPAGKRSDLKVKQELVVDLYRLIDPTAASKFDDLFDSANAPFNKFDRYNIMYLAYTADEPYRSTYLNTLGTYTLGNVTLTNGSFFTNGGSPGTPYAVANSVNLNSGTALYTDPKGPYTTFFHESGHAIDFNLGKNGAYSIEYKEGSNFDVIYSDVYNRIASETMDYINSNSVLKDKPIMTKLGYVVKVQSVIKNNKDTSGLSPYEKKIYNEVKNRFAVDLAKGGAYTNDYSGSPAIVRAGLSDIYGGITNNIIVDGRGHWCKKDTDGDGVGDTYSYWYYPDGENEGKPTNAQVTEMWAHYYSFGITGNTEAMNDMRDYMPSTMDRYDQMANDMMNNGL